MTQSSYPTTKIPIEEFSKIWNWGRGPKRVSLKNGGFVAEEDIRRGDLLYIQSSPTSTKTEEK